MQDPPAVLRPHRWIAAADGLWGPGGGAAAVSSIAVTGTLIIASSQRHSAGVHTIAERREADAVARSAAAVR